MQHVPVLDPQGKPLMPCSGKRARKLLERGDARPIWTHQVFGIRLLREPSARNLQPVVVAIDPGSKREGFTVKSAQHDYLNGTADAVGWVGKKLEARRMLRRQRRARKTPCRSPHRKNDRPDRIPAGTRARWEWKLRVLNWIATLYPVDAVIIEDIEAGTRPGRRRWNASFSPLEVGKAWFYDRISERWPLELLKGWQTAALREQFGVKKSRAKLADRWSAHCVDTWAMAASAAGGRRTPEHEDMLRIVPIQRQRRCLHRANASPGGLRRPYGGTNKGGLKTGTLVEHPRHGLCYTGGSNAAGRVSLHNLETGKRVTQGARRSDLRARSPLAWRSRFLPGLKAGVSTGGT